MDDGGWGLGGKREENGVAGLDEEYEEYSYLRMEAMAMLFLWPRFGTSDFGMTVEGVALA